MSTHDVGEGSGRSLRRRHARGRQTARGYTIVEVMSAMTLFAIGAAGVISMQRVTIQGGTDARRFDVASNIANEWTYRLQRDSMFWTQPNPAFPTTSNISATRWLSRIGTAGWQNPGIPGTNYAGVSAAADVFGRDLPPTEPPMFCTQMRLQWIADPGASMLMGALIRAEVRVIWARLDSPEIASCDGLNPDATPNAYHFVYATTVIRQNPTP